MGPEGKLEPGHVVAGKYRLERELGQGGMGSVFVAVHVSTLRQFAIKLLRPELAGDAEAEARFFREATLASSTRRSSRSTTWAATATRRTW